MKFIRKPKEVEAMFYTGGYAPEIQKWSNGMVTYVPSHPNGAEAMSMETKYGTGYAKPGTWVVRGSCGLFYPCSDKEFQDNYWEIK